MVLVGWRRQGGELFIASLTIGTDGAGAGLQVRRIDVLFGAGIFFHLLVRPAEKPCSLIVNRLGIKFRIGYREFEVQMAGVGTRPGLNGVKLVAVRIRVLVGPSAGVFKRNGIDHQRVAIPVTHFVAKEGRIGIFGVLAAIGRNQAIGCVPIEKGNMIGTLKELEGQRTGVVTRNAADNAETLGINGVLDVIFERGSTCLGEGQFVAGQILSDIPDRFVGARGYPIAGKIGMAVSHPRCRTCGQFRLGTRKLRDS